MLPTEPDTPETWLAWLNHPDAEARQAGACRFSLRFNGAWATEYLPNLVDILEGEPNHEVRWNLMMALDRLDPKCVSVAPALCGRLTDTDPEVRRSAAEQLRKMDPLPTEILADIRVLWHSDPDELVRVASASVLTSLSPEQGMAEDLSRIVSGCEDWYGRSLAILSLGNLGEEARMFRPVIEIAVMDKDESVREAAVFVLARWDGVKPAAENHTNLPSG